MNDWFAIESNAKWIRSDCGGGGGGGGDVEYVCVVRAVSLSQ